MTGSDPILVLGVGNEYRRDDGAGLHVAAEIAGRRMGGVTVRTTTGALGTWDGYHRVYVVDAVSSGAEAGTIHRFDAREEPLRPEVFRFSSHAFGLADAVELARKMGSLPDEMVIYGIEGRDFGSGQGLTTEVAQAAEETVEIILQEIGS